MARTHGATPPRKVRLWRWQSNPLRRRSDLVEAWLLLATLVLALLGGLFAGMAAAGAVDAALDERRERSRAVQAVLVENARDAAPAPVSQDGDGAVWAKVRWTAPDGTARTGRAEVEPGSRAVRTRAGPRVPRRGSRSPWQGSWSASARGDWSCSADGPCGPGCSGASSPSGRPSGGRSSRRGGSG